MKSVPPFAKHALGNGEQLFVRLDFVKQSFKIAFDLIAPDGFAIAFASALRAKVVGMAARVARRPASRERRIAIGAEHKAAQGKIFIEIVPTRRAGLALDLVLDAPERLERNQPFMLTFAKRNVPFGDFDISRIDRIAQKH